MPLEIRRHLELLNLSKPLQRYAARAQANSNASFMLVHKAMAKAFSNPSKAASGEALETSLREDIDRGVAAVSRTPGRRVR